MGRDKSTAKLGLSPAGAMSDSIVASPLRIWTSAMATAEFLVQQQPGASTFVIDEAGLITALHERGLLLTDNNPISSPVRESVERAPGESKR